VPGRTRPIRSSHASRGISNREVAPAMIGSVASGSQKSGISESDFLAPTKLGGATPMTVNGWPLIRYVAPVTDRSDPYVPCQVWKLITATGGDPARSSESAKNRPRQGAIPKLSKKLPETYSPLPVSTGA